MSVLPDDQMNSAINCLTAKSTWDDLILYYEGPSIVKESRVMDLKLCYNTFKFKEGESLTHTFTRYKALTNERLNDGVKLLKLEINTGFINGLPKKWLAFCQSFRNTNHVKESELASLFSKPKYEENLMNSTRSSQEYMNDLEEEYQARALLAKSKRFFKEDTQRFSSAKATDQTECHKCGKKGHFARDCKNKGLIAESYDWDEEEVSYDDIDVTKVKALMALADEERVSVGKESARNGEWIKISMKKVHTLLEMKDNDDRKSFVYYLCIDLNYVEEQRNNLMSKHRNLVQELNTCKEQLLVLKQAKFDLLTMQHCISEQIPTQKKKILGIDQLTKDTSSSGSKDPVFVKSSADNLKVSITGSNKPKLSEAEDSTLSNHDTADESLVCSTPFPLLEKLTGVEPVSGPKTIKSILKSKSTFKAETLKGITINEPSSAPARGNKSSSVSKTNSAPAGESSSRSRPSRPAIPFPSCIHCGYNDHKSDDCVYYPICEICGSYDHDTHGHNMIISLRIGIKPKNPQHVTKNCETYGSNIHTTSYHNDIEWFRKREALQAKKVESFKASKTESSSALRSKTPTKRWVSKQN
ncbi:retrovirus-related pol polyprotein from transposon TNT 1-94 [Tanacetum coccineum]